MKNQEQIVKFLHEAEKLKSVLRHSWLSSGRRESTAEHTWRMALMAMLVHPYLKKKPDLFKVIRIVLVHDLVEVYAGDIPAWAKDRSQKDKNEDLAMKKITRLLPGGQGKELYGLWKEYQQHKTLEAKFAKSLDKIEVLVQHQEGDIKHLRMDEFGFNLRYGVECCDFDPFLKDFRKLVNNGFLKLYRKQKVSPKLYK